MAVSKTVDTERVRQAIAAGQDLFGENYLQEARDKIAVLGRQVGWHLVGHLQTKKAKPAVELFDLIHAVDRRKLAGPLTPPRPSKTKSRTSSSRSIRPAKTPSPGSGRKQPRNCARGRPTAPPAGYGPDDHAAVVCRSRSGAPYFKALRELRDRLRDPTGLPLTELSMGMSGDFAVAVEEGATLVRVGTAIFGQRR